MSRYRNILAAIAATCCISANAGYFGAGTNRNASRVTYGTNAVTAIYSGSNLVWSAETDVLDGLAGWWKLDGSAADYKGGNNGVWSGTEEYTNSPNGLTQAGYFSGGSYVDLGTNTAVNSALSSTFTVSFWVNVQTNNTLIFGSRLTDKSRLIGTDIWLSGNMTVVEENTAVVLSVPYEYGVWEHWAWCYTGSAMCVYTNGAFGGTAPFTFSSIYDKGNEIGTSAIVGNYFLGSIYDLRVYNRALTSNEVNAVYNRYK